MYTITKERADELMLMHLTARREYEYIMCNHDEYSSERLEVLDEFIDVLMNEGIETLHLEMGQRALSLDEDGGDRRRNLSVKLMLRGLMSMSDAFTSAIE